MATDSSTKEDILLFEQQHHISQAISNGEERSNLRIIATRHDLSSWELTDGQQEYIRMCGLEQLSNMSRLTIDHALITALVERWRPETNTFHLPCGEATVTLEDVAYIYGLPIDGPAVTGKALYSTEDTAKLCQDLLQKVPVPKRDSIGTRIKFSWMKEICTGEKKKKKKNTSVDKCKARAYLFCLAGGQIVSNATGTSAPAWLLSLFKEFKRYAWGPACLANLYRMLSKASMLVNSGDENEDEKGKKDKKKIDIDSSDTLTGPVQLLQIWAYSRMAFVRPNDHYLDIRKNFDFPLYKPWIKSISKFRPPMNLKDRRGQLDDMKHEEFIWCPYEEIIDKLTKVVHESDRNLFTSNTVMIFYWIVERHNSARVMRQFGLRQLVPVPFHMPFNRADKAKKSVADYSTSMKEVIAIWEKREEDVVRGESDASPTHDDSYMTWYASVTRLRIAPPLKDKIIDEPLTPTHATEGDEAPLTPTAATKGDDDILIPQKPVLFILEELKTFMEGNKRRADELKSDAILRVVRNKVEHLIDAVKDQFKGFDYGETSKNVVPVEKSLSPKLKAILKKKMEQTMTVSKDQSSPKEHSSHVTSKDTGLFHVSSVSTRRSPRFSSSTPIQMVSDSTPPKNLKKVISAGPSTEKVPSMVIRVKNATRKKKRPAKFDGFSTTFKWPQNSEYKLTDEETTALNQFWDDYYKNKDELSSYCTSPPPKKLKKLLSREWMDTGTLQSWFDVSLKAKAPNAYFIDANASDMWLKQSKESYIHIFGEHGWRVDVMRKREVIVIPVIYLAHFTVIIGRPKEGKWEFYNSMPGDEMQWPKAEEFIIWLNDCFAEFGWEDPKRWTRHHVEDTPIQDNTNDCGFFVMGFAEHAVLNRTIAFTQQDMNYYRCKLVVDLYIGQRELYEKRLKSSTV